MLNHETANLAIFFFLSSSFAFVNINNDNCSIANSKFWGSFENGEFLQIVFQASFVVSLGTLELLELNPTREKEKKNFVEFSNRKRLHFHFSMSMERCSGGWRNFRWAQEKEKENVTPKRQCERITRRVDETSILLLSFSSFQVFASVGKLDFELRYTSQYYWYSLLHTGIIRAVHWQPRLLKSRMKFSNSTRRRKINENGRTSKKFFYPIMRNSFCISERIWLFSWSNESAIVIVINFWNDYDSKETSKSNYEQDFSSFESFHWRLRYICSELFFYRKNSTLCDTLQ